MNLPEDVIIPREKLTRYLLVYQPENDKSKFLAQGGYTQENPEQLEFAIRDMLTRHEALYERSDRFGDYYRIEGTLKGVNDHDLLVVTIWIMRTEETGVYRFVTLKPWRKKDAT